MTDIRTFLRNMGEDAPAFFEVEPKTIKRWISTGNVPIKKAEKIFAAMRAMEQSGSTQNAQPQSPQVATDPSLDPLTHLPVNLDRTYTGVPPVAGKLPDTIEISPVEQSFGNNMTRPGRPSPQPMKPMKLRDEGGSKVAYVENTPAIADMKNPDGTPRAPILPPTIANDWAAKGDPLPETIKKPNPNDPRPAQRQAAPVSQEQVP